MSFFINFGGTGGGEGGAVSSVNGEIGDVILNYNDVGAVANILKTCGGIQVGTLENRPLTANPNVLYIVTNNIPNEFYRYNDDNSEWEQIGSSEEIGSLLAINVKFDNTGTGLTSINVQDVIEEINNALTSLESDVGDNTNEITDLKLKVGSGKVKMTSTDTLDYLDTKVDNDTIMAVTGKLVAKTIDGLNTTITELNYSSGVKSNIQAQIDSLSNVGNFTGSVDTHADLSNLTNMNISDMVIVIEDETHNDVSTIYMYDGTDWQYVGEFKVEMRDFSTNPIDLATEVKGKLPIIRLDASVVLDTEIDIPLLNRFTDTDGTLLYNGEPIGIGNDGSVHGSVKQLIRKNIIAPETVKLSLPNLNTFSGIPLEVLILEEGEKNVINQLDSFDNKDRYENNDYIEVNKLKLKNEYEFVTEEVEEDIYRFDLMELISFKSIIDFDIL